MIDDSPGGVQRCRLCCFYRSDSDAAPALACHIDGAQVWFYRQVMVEAVRYDGTPTALVVDRYTNAWITTADGEPIEWTPELTHRAWNRLDPVPS